MKRCLRCGSRLLLWRRLRAGRTLPGRLRGCSGWSLQLRRSALGPCSGCTKGSPGGSRCGSLRSSCGRKAALLRKFFLRRRRRGLKRVRRLCLQERPRRGALLGLERRAGAGGDTVGAPVFLLQITICHDSLLTHEIAERFCSDSKRIPEWIPGLGGGKTPRRLKNKKAPRREHGNRTPAGSLPGRSRAKLRKITCG